MGIYGVHQVKSSVDFFLCHIEVNDWNQIYFVSQHICWLISRIWTYFIKNDYFYNVLIESCWRLGSNLIHFSKIYLLLDQKEKQVNKWIFKFPSPSINSFFILFLTRYQALTFIQKP